MINNLEAGTSLVYAVIDTQNGGNVPSMPLGETEDGKGLVAKAVFSDGESADAMAGYLDNKVSAEGRFKVEIVELWRPTDIEVYARKRIRESEKDKGPKLILPQ